MSMKASQVRSTFLVKRGLLIGILLGGCATDGQGGRPPVEVKTHTTDGRRAPGVTVNAYDADGTIVESVTTDDDAFAEIDVPEGGAVGSAVEIVTAVSPGDHLDLGSTFRRNTGIRLDVRAPPPPAGVTVLDWSAGCDSSVESYAACPDTDDHVDVLLEGFDDPTLPYAFALDADAAGTITLGAWQTVRSAASLTVENLSTEEMLSPRAFAVSERSFVEVGFTGFDERSATLQLPTNFAAQTGYWARVGGGTLAAGWMRGQFALVDGAFGDVVLDAVELPPRIEDVTVTDREATHPTVSWQPPAGDFDAIVIHETETFDGDFVDYLLILPPDTQPPISLPGPLRQTSNRIFITYEGYDTFDGYDDVKARGIYALQRASFLDRARAGVRTMAWSGDE